MELIDLQEHWEALGKTDPLWAILTHPDKRERRWDTVEFFRSGREEIGNFLEYLDKLGKTPARGSALDFGCGVGRLTQALCGHFERCSGVDIASSMIEQARQFNAYGERCQYFVNHADDLRLFPDNSFDLTYSNIVLQHMEPRYSTAYIREFVRVLKPGGMTYFQLPSGIREEGTMECPAVPMTAFRAELTIVSMPETMRNGQPAVVRVRVRNTSEVGWPGHGSLRVRLGNHWLGADSSILVLDDGRADLPHDVAAGGECVLDLRVTPPQGASATLELDMLQEHVAWFKDQGSPTLLQEVALQPSSTEAAPEEPRFAPVIEMYGVPTAEVRQILEDAGADVIDAQENGSAGPAWLSYHYVAVKR